MRATALLAALLVAGIIALLPAVAGSLYRRAERDFQAGDYEKAALRCERALQLNPSHAPAKALLMEVQFILGQFYAPSRVHQYPIHMGDWSYQGILRDMDQALARAEDTGDEREWRKVLEYAKWLPDGVEVRMRADLARAYLECVAR